MPCVYDGGALNSEDALQDGPARTRPGASCPDAPVGDGYLLPMLGNDFVVLTIDADAPDALEENGIKARHVAIKASDDPSGQLAARYLGGATSAVYLIRPDQHVAMRMAQYDDAALRAALRLATGQEA